MATRKQIRAELLKVKPVFADRDVLFAIDVFVECASTLPIFAEGEVADVLIDLQDYLVSLLYSHPMRYKESFFADRLMSLAEGNQPLLAKLKGIEFHLNLLKKNEDYKKECKAKPKGEIFHHIVIFASSNVMTLPIEYVLDYLAIANFFRNISLCEIILKDLETELQAYATFQQAKLEEYNDTSKKLPRTPPLQKQKILSGYLYQWARYNGFNQTMYAKIQAGLLSYVFLQQLDKNVFFKDGGLGDAHGDWAHAIQLYLMIEGNKKFKFLKHYTPTELYQYMGSDSPRRNQLWLIIFDGRDHGNKFGCPEFITRYFGTDAISLKYTFGKAMYPLLSDLYMRQQQKNQRLGGREPVIYRSYPSENEDEQQPTMSNIRSRL